MGDFPRFKYIPAVVIALLALLFLPTPLAEGSLALRVFEQGIKPAELENHPARAQALVCNATDKKFDLIVGNPPYIRYQYFDRKQQVEAEERRQEVEE